MMTESAGIFMNERAPANDCLCFRQLLTVFRAFRETLRVLACVIIMLKVWY